jgi:hypothetical protein
MRVMAAVPLAEGSSTLAAMTVTAWVSLIAAGAVYKPVGEMVPSKGWIDHLTPGSVAPVTVAVNCRLWEAPRVTAPGLTATVIAGFRVMVAVALAAGVATLVALTSSV